MWGQDLPFTISSSRDRIIPTRVGTSVPAPPLGFNSQDHPHACGDKFTSVKICFADGGSSPRVWGQGYVRIALIIRHRIIPTRVGTSECLERLIVQCQDHPHACGDKAVKTSQFLNYLGSSPRVWGQERICESGDNIAGIIPTRVGTSDTCALCVKKLQDHPHACGDKWYS